MRLLPALGVSVAWTLAWWIAYPRLGPWIHAQGMRLLGSTADYFFTYMGPELLLFGFGLVGVPALYLSMFRYLSLALQFAAVVLSVVMGVLTVYGDVFAIARDAERFCTTEAGLKTHRRVTAPSIFGLHDPSALSRFGVHTVEYRDYRDRIWRVSLTKEGVQTREVDSIASSFEYRQLQHRSVTPHIGRTQVMLVERASGDVVAEAHGFRIFRGWADRVIDFGLHFRPPLCWQGKPISRGGKEIRLPRDLLRAALNSPT